MYHAEKTYFISLNVDHNGCGRPIKCIFPIKRSSMLQNVNEKLVHAIKLAKTNPIDDLTSLFFLLRKVEFHVTQVCTVFVFGWQTFYLLTSLENANIF